MGKTIQQIYACVRLATVDPVAATLDDPPAFLTLPRECEGIWDCGGLIGSFIIERTLYYYILWQYSEHALEWEVGRDTQNQVMLRNFLLVGQGLTTINSEMGLIFSIHSSTFSLPENNTVFQKSKNQQSKWSRFVIHIISQPQLFCACCDMAFCSLWSTFGGTTQTDILCKLIGFYLFELQAVAILALAVSVNAGAVTYGAAPIAAAVSPFKRAFLA